MEQSANNIKKVPLECLLGVISALVGTTRTEKEKEGEAVPSFPSGAKGKNFQEKTQQRPSLKIQRTCQTKCPSRRERKTKVLL